MAHLWSAGAFTNPARAFAYSRHHPREYAATWCVDKSFSKSNRHVFMDLLLRCVWAIFGQNSQERAVGDVNLLVLVLLSKPAVVPGENKHPGHSQQLFVAIHLQHGGWKDMFNTKSITNLVVNLCEGTHTRCAALVSTITDSRSGPLLGSPSGYSIVRC